MKTVKPLYRRFLFKYAISPFTYLVALLLVVASSVRFFLLQKFFTSLGSTDLRIFFQGIPYVSILAIPALAAILPFGSDEAYWPGKGWEHILSKILSLATVLAISTVLTFIVPLVVAICGDLQVSQLVSGYLILLLYILASSSLALMIFSRVQNKGIAFVLLALILFTVNASHLLPLYFELPSWLSNLAKGISFAWHFDAAGKGIIDSRDIVFYLAVVFLTFSFTVTGIEKRKGNPSKRILQYRLFTVLTFVLLLVDSSRVYGRVDLTKSKQFTVSSYSKKIMDEIQEPFTISYYRTPSLKNTYPQVRDVEDFLREYADSNRNIELKILDPVKEDAIKRLNNYGIYGEQIDTSDRGDSISFVYSAIVLSYLGRIEVIPTVYTTSTLEFDLTSRMEQMVLGRQRVVQVVVGNGMMLDEDYSYVMPWLESNGFLAVQTYRPSEAEEFGELSFEDFPTLPMLVLGTSYFNQQDTYALENIIEQGGEVFIATTPYSVDIANDWSVNPQPDNVIYLLQKYGLYFKDTLTADVSNFRITFYSDTSTGGESASPQTEYVNYPLWPVLLSQKNAVNGLATFWPCALEKDSDVAAEKNCSIEELLFTSNLAWQIDKIDGKFQTNPFYIEKTPEDSSLYQQECISAKLQIENQQKADVIVFGDQYAYTTMMFNYAAGSVGDLRSMDYLLDSLLFLNGQEEILPLKNRSYKNTSLYKVNVDSSLKTKVLLAVVLVPLLILTLLYLAVSTWRKRKNSVLSQTK